MNDVVKGYNRLAGMYERLEHLAFGSLLEKARTAHLASLASCRHVLILGQGDGRFLSALVQQTPQVSVDCIDISPRMLSLSRQRLARLQESDARVHFHQQDILTAALPKAYYDLIVTHFFLDLFPLATLERLIPNLACSVKSGGLWLYSDFQVPPLGLPRLRAQLWLALLYRFFSLQTAIPARRLSNPDPLILKEGFRLERVATPRGGLVSSHLYRRA